MIAAVPTSITAFIGFASDGPVNAPTLVRSFTDFSRTFGALSAQSTMSSAIDDYFLNGGSEAIVVRAANGANGEQPIAELVPPVPNGRGLYALDKADLFNLLGIPPIIRSGDLPTSALIVASAYCAKRQALLIVDPHSSWLSPADVASGVTSLESSAGLAGENAAIYFPRIRRSDPLLGGALDTFPPCGAVAGVIARLDSRHGIWKTPAGQEADLAGVESLSVTLTSAEASSLSGLGINCLRTFPGVGSVIWGGRTLQQVGAPEPEWKFIAVRRTAMFLEESLLRGTKWAVFEPNGEPLWAQIRREVAAFMHDLYWKGAFQGTTPDRAYFVKCDSETTTPADIDAGIVNIEVGFAPLRPAEFLILRIAQRAQTA